MIELFSTSTYFFTALTVIAFALASALQKKTRMVILNPIMIAALVIIAFLAVLDIPVDVYQDGCKVLSYLLTPATICLAISFYEQLNKLKKHLLPIFIGVLAGVLCSAGSIYLLSKLFSLPDTILFSLLPKSVTSAIGIPLSEEIGGIGALTMAAICITGISGNILAPLYCKWFRLDDPISQGVAIGTSSHVIGTTRAIEMGELTGAVSSLALTVAAIATAFFLSTIVPYL
ncbi:MAG: LrgB family protein [Oscillospiraceae bacterium]|nr:LrgB family protein [Oscillospiraceae bacterium]